MRNAIEDFLAQKRIAVVGASRNRDKFGNKIYRALRARGYEVYPINPAASQIEGDKVYPNLGALPLMVDGVITIVPPKQTEKVVRECARLGIKRVWMQPGSESEEAISFLKEHGIPTVYDVCMLMTVAASDNAAPLTSSDDCRGR